MDSDGLKDGEEDKNQNGILDGDASTPIDDVETDPQKADTDDDGTPDKVEIESEYGWERLEDGTFKLDSSGDLIPQKTHPRNPDSDSDGIKDGEEDIDKNGFLDYSASSGVYVDLLGDVVKDSSGNPIAVITAGVRDSLSKYLCSCNFFGESGCIYPTETNPTLEDSNCNNSKDNDEAATLICKEENYIKLESLVNEKKSHLAILSSLNSEPIYNGFNEISNIEVPRTGEKIGSIFYDLSNGIGGFIITSETTVSFDDPKGQREADFALLTGETFTDQQSAIYDTWDGNKSETVTAKITSSSSYTVKELINEYVFLMSGEDAPKSLIGLFAEDLTLADYSEWEISWQTIVKEDAGKFMASRIVSIVPASSITDDKRIQMENLSGGSSFAASIDEFKSFCQSFFRMESKVDIIWVVDNSGSMVEEQDGISSAVDTMADILSNTDRLDWRVAVVSTDEGLYDTDNATPACIEWDSGSCKKLGFYPADGAFLTWNENSDSTAKDDKRYVCNGKATSGPEYDFSTNEYLSIWGKRTKCFSDERGYENLKHFRHDAFTSDIEAFRKSVRILDNGTGLESGLKMTKRTIKRHWYGNGTIKKGDLCKSNSDSCIRDDAKLIVIVLSDEHPAWVCDDESGSFNCNYNKDADNGDFKWDRYREVKNFLNDTSTTFYSITLHDDRVSGFCSGVPDSMHKDDIYKNMAIDTGGAFASICDDPQTDNMKVITKSLVAKTGKYLLNYKPIASSIRVGYQKDGSPHWIPRISEDGTDGFYYNYQENKLIFKGSILDGVNDVAVSYKFWKSGK